MSIRLSALVIASALAVVPSLASAATLDTYSVNNWSAGAYSNDQTGEFSHCAASSNYRSGISMAFAVSKKFTWSMGFANPKWQLTKGNSYPITFRVDGSGEIDGTAVAVNNALVEVQLADSSRLFNRFRHGNILVVYAADETMKFYLTDTITLLPSLLRCVNQWKSYEPPRSTSNNSRSPNPFEREQPSQPLQPSSGSGVEVRTESSNSTPPPQANPTNEATPINGTDSADRAAEATSLVANILANSGVKGFQILSAEEAKKFKTDAAWRAGDAFGTLSIIGNESSKPEQMNAQIISSDAQACHDKFFSGSMPDASGSRLFTSCKSNGKTLTIFYSTIKRSKGGYYVMATGGFEATSQGDGHPTRELDTGMRTAAFHIVTADQPAEASNPPVPSAPAAPSRSGGDEVVPDKMR